MSDTSGQQGAGDGQQQGEQANAGQQGTDGQQQGQQDDGLGQIPDVSQMSVEEIRAELQRRQDMVLRYRREAGDRRKQTRQQEQQTEHAQQQVEDQRKAIRSIAESLGIEVLPEQAATVEQVTQTLQQTQTRLARAGTENALLHAALAENVDPSRLEFLEFTVTRSPEFRALDATAADYRDRVSTIVAAQVTKDATLRRSGTPGGASAADGMTGSGGASEITPEAFAAMNMAERNALFTSDPATYRRLAG